jgi:hypothetical protein
MGAGASASGAAPNQVVSLEQAAVLIGPTFNASAVTKADGESGGVSLRDLFSVYGVELAFGDAVTAVAFDSDRSRGRCFVELKDAVRNYSGVFRTLYAGHALEDPERGMLRQEFCDMLEKVGATHGRRSFAAVACD